MNMINIEAINVIIPSLFFAFLIVFLIMESMWLSFYGYHYIYGKGVDMLRIEISDCDRYIFSCGHLHTSRKTELDVRSIYDIMSIVTPYVVNCGDVSDDISYRVIRWSKAYFLIKNKLKELHPPKPKIKYLKF